MVDNNGMSIFCLCNFFSQKIPDGGAQQTDDGKTDEFVEFRVQHGRQNVRNDVEVQSQQDVIAHHGPQAGNAVVCCCCFVGVTCDGTGICFLVVFKLTSVVCYFGGA